jgi:hypothetical protein
MTWVLRQHQPDITNEVRTYGFRASPTVFSMWPCNNIFHIQGLVMYSFATPLIKLKLGQQTGRGLLIANHLDQIIMMGQSEHWAAFRSYLLHSFLQAHTDLLHLFPAVTNLGNYAEPKPISWAKPTNRRFSSSKNVEDHIPSTTGDALTGLVPVLNQFLNTSNIPVTYPPRWTSSH